MCKIERGHKGTGQLEPRRKVGFGRDMVRGLYRLHTHSPVVLHCDLKSLNLLVDENWRLKLCDFGESAFEGGGKKTVNNRLTPHWAAPEVLCGERFTQV
jgi:serine/threonine protein kinase